MPDTGSVKTQTGAHSPGASDDMQLIILDRDGVINYDSDNYIRTLDEWVALPGSIEAIADLSKAGYSIAIATNQSGIGRGYYSLATLAAMHQKMCELVQAQGGEIAHILYCPHLPDDHCMCRKPLPGMLQQILEYYPSGIDAYFIGDSLRDIQAAQAINLPAVLVKTGKGQRSLERGLIGEDIPVYDDLLHFSQQLLTPDQRM